MNQAHILFSGYESDTHHALHNHRLMNQSLISIFIINDRAITSRYRLRWFVVVVMFSRETGFGIKGVTLWYFRPFNRWGLPSTHEYLEDSSTLHFRQIDSQGVSGLISLGGVSVFFYPSAAPILQIWQVHRGFWRFQYQKHFNADTVTFLY